MEFTFKPKYRLGKITNKYHILDIIFSTFYKQKGIVFLTKTSRCFRKLLRENLKAALSMSEDALHHILDLPRTLSQIALPVKEAPVHFVYLHEDLLYSEAGKTLYVYSVTDLAAPLAAFPLGGPCLSGLISDSHLYLGVYEEIQVFEVTSSHLQPPIKLVTVIETQEKV